MTYYINKHEGESAIYTYISMGYRVPAAEFTLFALI